jgi:flagellar hook-associated protein 2
MSGITSGIGLISGIDTATLIDQLMAIERRPVENLQKRVSAIEKQRTAFAALSAQLLAVQNAGLAFGRSSFFKQFSSASTNDRVLTATAGETAALGSYTFRVRSLVTNHALISRGFADADRTPVGVGTLTIEVGNGRVNKGTSLDVLNGGAGVRRGVITVTDRSGASADIDLTTAMTVEDVLNAINANGVINVRASVSSVAFNGATGDRIVIEDLNSPEHTGPLMIADRIGGSTAADLGLAANVTANRVDGRDLVRLSSLTPMSLLNDGNGVGRLKSGPDLVFTTAFGNFTASLTNNLAMALDTDLRILNSGNGVRLGTIRITDRSGKSAEIDLSTARTVRDVLDAVNAADVSISATVIQINDDSFFQIVDTSGASAEGENAPKLMIEDVTGFTAADLGIAGEVDVESIRGSDVYRIDTIGDVINAINYAPANNSLVQASISPDGNTITLRALGLGNTLTVAAGQDDSGNVSTAAQDLGLLGAGGVAVYESPYLIAGLNTVLLRSLNGGTGVQVGTVRFTDGLGQTAEIDFSQAHTLQDVIDLINLDQATSLTAAVNPAGNGIVIKNESSGGGSVVIEDVNASLAADLKIAGTYAPEDGGSISSGNLQTQYISRQTLLSQLNGGTGVALGSFRITDSTGAVYMIALDETARTVGDVIDAINRLAPDTIQVRINDTGDGIAITDTSAGSPANGGLTIEDLEGGRAAADLRLAGKAQTGQNFIDGSFEIRIDVAADDTLNDVVQKINDARAGVQAAVLSDGGTVNPFSLTFTSTVSGRRGELVVDSTGVNLGLMTLSQAQDAIITIGDDTGGNVRTVSSPTNTVDDVVQGVTLNLLSANEEPVTVTVAQDIDSIVEAVSTFVEKYNAALDAIDQSTRFNPDTLERGPLMGDPTANLLRSRLQRVVLKKFEGVDESMSRLFSVGLWPGEGNRLQFDEEKFREVYEQSPQLVEDLFTQEKTGLAAVLKDTIEGLTRDFDGVLSRKDELLVDQQELLNKRIDSLNVLLDAKRARLEAQFVGLESSLAALQAQQSALNALSQMTAGG